MTMRNVEFNNGLNPCPQRRAGCETGINIYTVFFICQGLFLYV
jgi:hypothetical protein